MCNEFATARSAQGAPAEGHRTPSRRRGADRGARKRRAPHCCRAPVRHPATAPQRRASRGPLSPVRAGYAGSCRHDRGVLAHRAAARRHSRPRGPELRPRGGAAPRPRRGGHARRGPEPADTGRRRRHPGVLGGPRGRARGGVPGRPGLAGLGPRRRRDPGEPEASRARWAGGGCTGRSAWSTWRRRRNCSPPRSARCGSSPGTRAGARASWRTNSTDGAWYVVESEPGDVSSPDPESLWRAVLRRQRSELAMVATYPDDPSLN